MLNHVCEGKVLKYENATGKAIPSGEPVVIGALFAREVARHVRVDYRLLVASAYSGFVVWHGGLSGSISSTTPS